MQLLRYALVFVVVIHSQTVAMAEDRESKFYDPIERDVEGWTIATDPKLLEDENSQLLEDATKALANHLQRIKFVMPKAAVKELQKLRIWMDLEHELSNMQYHPGRGWLIGKGYDPRLAKHVHIPRAANLLKAGQWAKHPYVVLHELAHAYHDQVLGFNYPPIAEAYEAIKESGSYEDVLLYTGRRVKHYALTTPMEYFAESTEAYVGVNDFYPFVRAELKEHDPAMFRLQEEIWGKIR